MPPGHPLHTLRAENEALTGVLERLRALLGKPDRLAELRKAFDQLVEVERHYLRKENQLFPALEAHGLEGPTKVMWAIRDDIRAKLKVVRTALERGEAAAVRAEGEQLLTMVTDMIYKEERILFPSALNLLTESDWRRIRQGEDELGYAFGVRPGTVWEHAGATQDGIRIMVERFGTVQATGEAAQVTGTVPGQGIPLDTGLLSVEQLNLLLRNLPVDVSFVDEYDEVRYYSEGERVFPRSLGVIGRKVQNCHPPKSVHVVQRILDEFRAGTKNVAEFWLQQDGRFIHIRYFALRDRQGSYKGTLEVVQDATHLRQLGGERRLLEW